MTAVALLDSKTTDPHLDGSDVDVALAASGDLRAFERVYHRHVPRVLSLCVRMADDRMRGEELAQDVFVRAWEKLHLFRGESAFGTWLHRMAINVVLNARKAEGRQLRRFGKDEDDAMDGLPARPHAPGDRMDLERAISTLPKGARRVFILHDVEGYKHEEIAELLGVTTGATKAQLHRARLLLREALNR